MEIMQLQPVRAKQSFPILYSNDPLPITSLRSTLDKPISRLPFIEANTKEVDFMHLQKDCIVPVFSKDNEVTISHPEFIEAIWNAANTVFPQEEINKPLIRVSHIIKGRTPEAVCKPVNMLLEEEKTIYYERMMFCFEIPTIFETIDGSRLNLTIGGVRAYNHENLYSKKSMEKFKVFIGFKNLVCCNMCVSTDGYKSELKVMSVNDLMQEAIRLFQSYKFESHLQMMSALQNYSMTEHQFAQFIGKSRLYQYIPASSKKLLPPVLLTDTQIGLVARSYYQDENFSQHNDNNKEISVWNVYNLFTGANKTSYIDNFLDRANNVSDVAFGLCDTISNVNKDFAWFIE